MFTLILLAIIVPSAPTSYEIDTLDFNTVFEMRDDGRIHKSYDQTLWWKDGHVADFVYFHGIDLPVDRVQWVEAYDGSLIRLEVRDVVWTCTLGDPQAVDELPFMERINFMRRGQENWYYYGD